MGLEENCQQYEGNKVVVEPVHGWGWSLVDTSTVIPKSAQNGLPIPYNAFDNRQAQQAVSTPLDPPEIFGCQLIRFFSSECELRGGIGRVCQANHSLNRQWVVFYTRQVGEFNFTEQQPYCSIQVSTGEPLGEWPEFAVGQTIHFGYAFIAESISFITQRHRLERGKCVCPACQSKRAV